MATDRYSKMLLWELEKEMQDRGLKIDGDISATPTGRREQLRKALRNDDEIRADEKDSPNIVTRILLTLLAILVVICLVIGVLWVWDNYGTRLAVKNVPTLSFVAVAQPTYTPYPVQPTYTPYPVQPTFTPLATSVLPTNVVTASETITDPIVLADPLSTWNQGQWSIKEYDLQNDPIVKAWLQKLRDPAPELWKVYPNVPNPDVPEFSVANGMEYGMADSPFCEQDQRCDFVVPAWHYRLITGDYKFLNFGCSNTEQTHQGCMLLLINVMDQSYTWRNQSVDNGFTVFGRYWNGDALDWGVWGLVSDTAANMLGMETYRNPLTGDVLNSGNLPGDAGSNCGTPEACPTVNVRVVVHAGDRILAIAETTVSRP